mmetsp:Transcript_14855/g.46395  ORF Transcript_14855/g.46395 Transcript_14855/m.46395 type:complete len:341 (-) Transcript_14855:91-1113(-)
MSRPYGAARTSSTKAPLFCSRSSSNMRPSSPPPTPFSRSVASTTSALLISRTACLLREPRSTCPSRPTRRLCIAARSVESAACTRCSTPPPASAWSDEANSAYLRTTGSGCTSSEAGGGFAVRAMDCCWCSISTKNLSHKSLATCAKKSPSPLTPRATITRSCASEILRSSSTPIASYVPAMKASRCSSRWMRVLPKMFSKLPPACLPAPAPKKSAQKPYSDETVSTSSVHVDDQIDSSYTAAPCFCTMAGMIGVLDSSTDARSPSLNAPSPLAGPFEKSELIDSASSPSTCPRAAHSTLHLARSATCARKCRKKMADIVVLYASATSAALSGECSRRNA